MSAEIILNGLSLFSLWENRKGVPVWHISSIHWKVRLFLRKWLFLCEWNNCLDEFIEKLKNLNQKRKIDNVKIRLFDYSQEVFKIFHKKKKYTIRKLFGLVFDICKFMRKLRKNRLAFICYPEIILVWTFFT